MRYILRDPKAITDITPGTLITLDMLVVLIDLSRGWQKYKTDTLKPMFRFMYATVSIEYILRITVNIL